MSSRPAAGWRPTISQPASWSGDTGTTARMRRWASRPRPTRTIHYGTAGHNLGMTYPDDEWKRGGGAAWAWYSYDPELKLIYYGSGNPGLWSPSYRCGANPPTQEACNS